MKIPLWTQKKKNIRQINSPTNQPHINFIIHHCVCVTCELLLLFCESEGAKHNFLLLRKKTGHDDDSFVAPICRYYCCFNCIKLFFSDKKIAQSLHTLSSRTHISSRFMQTHAIKNNNNKRIYILLIEWSQ